MKYIIATLGCKVNQYESEAMEQLPSESSQKERQREKRSIPSLHKNSAP